MSGELPTEKQGLSALSEKPENYPADREWVQILELPIKDPWSNPYQYFRALDLKNGYGIYSLGPDGISATRGNDLDDFKSWQRDKPLPVRTQKYRDVSPYWLSALSLMTSFGLFVNSRKQAKPRSPRER